MIHFVRRGAEAAESLYEFLRGWDDGHLPGDFFEASAGT
jgi:hypothetical protein